METTEIKLALPTETGMLGICYIKTIWSRAIVRLKTNNIPSGKTGHLDYLVINALGLGYEQTFQYLFQVQPSFEQFENWIVETTGGIKKEQVDRINAVISGTKYPDEINERIKLVERSEPVLTEEDLKFWDENGYVIVHDSVPDESRLQALKAILAHVGADLDNPETWYKKNDHGIMVQYFQNPAFDVNRNSLRIHKAFAQLWGTADLWVSTDRCGFNVPERPGWKFRGPDLHWDVSIQLPVPFGTQGILYLTDTPAEQGAFTCVPGFQRRIDEWINSLSPGINPRTENLHALGSTPIAGKAGDLVIWHQALPHGSRPNLGVKPRIVQYINMYPTNIEVQDIWK